MGHRIILLALTLSACSATVVDGSESSPDSGCCPTVELELTDDEGTYSVVWEGDWPDTCEVSTTPEACVAYCVSGEL